MCRIAHINPAHMSIPTQTGRTATTTVGTRRAKGDVVILASCDCLDCAPIRRNAMLQTIAVILVILWLLGMVSSYTMGGFIHLLLVVAVVVVLARVISGRSPV